MLIVCVDVMCEFNDIQTNTFEWFDRNQWSGNDWHIAKLNYNKIVIFFNTYTYNLYICLKYNYSWIIHYCIIHPIIWHWLYLCFKSNKFVIVYLAHSQIHLLFLLITNVILRDHCAAADCKTNNHMHTQYIGFRQLVWRVFYVCVTALCWWVKCMWITCHCNKAHIQLCCAVCLSSINHMFLCDVECVCVLKACKAISE